MRYRTRTMSRAQYEREFGRPVPLTSGPTITIYETMPYTDVLENA